MPKHGLNYQSVCRLRNALTPWDKFLTKSGETIKSLYNNRYVKCERLNFKQHNLISFACIENISESENTCF